MSVIYAAERVSDPRFRPHQFTSEPDAFGKAAIITWLPAGPGGEDQLMASQFQHTYAVAIRAEARRRYGSLKEYAKAAGVDYQRLTKLLRGEAIMRLEDVASARRHLGAAIPTPVADRA